MSNMGKKLTLNQERAKAKADAAKKKKAEAAIN
jgi:hypothetical protein